MTTPGPRNPDHTPLLTTLSNRGQALERLAVEIDRSQRETSHRFCVLLVQFDGLSRLADRVGRTSRNSVWEQAFDVLTGDVSPSDLCCRLGGDDFLLIFPGKGASECGDVVDSLHRRWTLAVNMQEAAIQMSVGIASYPAHATTVPALFAAADEALQAHRSRGFPDQNG